MPQISVITPTVRLEGLELVKRALKRQTFTDFEHIIMNRIGEPEENLYWTVYREYNRAVQSARGDLIVSWQDFTYAGPDTLEKFWAHYQDDPKVLVSAVGNKYEDDTWTVETWRDPRQRDDQGSFYECYHNDIEWNLAGIPKEAIYAVGGFDEQMDHYSSLCGLDVAQRLEFIGGWKFYLDQTIKTYSLEHGRLPQWEEKLPFNGPWQDRKREYITQPKLKYLI
jgi:hypothetical protein